jgi:serine/threonine-protein kinase
VSSIGQERIGQQLGGYTLVGKIGTGGTSVVYYAQHPHKGDVAVKVLGGRWAAESDFARRFKREARVIAQLDHLHIVRLIEAGREGETNFLAMEYLAGGSLWAAMRQGPLAPEYASRIVNQLAEALDYAHAKNIIHRDMKPSNVLFDKHGVTKLTDFGLAKALNTDSTGITKPYTSLGTPWYMAPEQFQGTRMTGQTDVYGLGVMLFEMLAGRLPFDGETAERLMYQHLNDKPIPLTAVRPELPRAMQAVVEKALAKKPEDRYRSAGELADAFGALLGTVGSKTPHQSAAESMMYGPTAHLRGKKRAASHPPPDAGEDGATSKFPTPHPKPNTPASVNTSSLLEAYSPYVDEARRNDQIARRKKRAQTIMYVGFAVAMAAALVALVSLLFP